MNPEGPIPETYSAYPENIKDAIQEKIDTINNVGSCLNHHFELTWYSDKADGEVKDSIKKAINEVLPEYVLDEENFSLSFATMRLLYEERFHDFKAYVERFDQTGSYIPQLYNSRIGSLIKEGDVSASGDGQHIRILQESGRHEKDSIQDKVFFSVSVDNLAMVNTLNGHSSGDSCLIETVSVVSSKLKEFGLKETDFEIFHTKGSDFIVLADRLGFKNLEAEKDFVEEIRNSNLASSPPFKVNLVASKISFEDIAVVFNSIQDSLPQEQKIDISDQLSDTRKILLTLLTNTLEMQREFNVLKSLTEQVYDLKSIDKDSDSEAYFDVYVKKFFEGTKFSKYEAFSKFSRDGDVLVDTILQIVESRSVAEWAVNQAVGTFIGKVAFEKAALVSGMDKAGVREKDSARFIGEGSASGIYNRELWNNKPYKRLLGEKEPDIKILASEAAPGYVSEIQELKKLQKTLTNFGASLLRDPKSLSLAELKLYTDSYKEFASNYSGRFDIFTSMPSDIRLQENMKILNLFLFRLENISGHEEILKEDVLQLKLINDQTMELVEEAVFQRDELTGLIKKEEFFKRTFDKVGHALLDGSDVTLLLGDLANLRYTNDLGGRKTGDWELCKVAASLEKATSSDPDAIVSKYGGDEFALLITGDKAVAKNFVQNAKNLLSNTRDGTPLLVPASSSAKEGFLPHKISLDFGYISLKEGIDQMTSLLDLSKKTNSLLIFNPVDEENLQVVHNTVLSGGELDITSPEAVFYVKTLVRLMMRHADARIGIQKGFNKFQNIYQLYEANSESSGGNKDKVFDALKIMWSYSSKSLGNRPFSVIEDIENELKGGDLTVDIFEKYFHANNMPVEESALQQAMRGAILDFVKQTAK